MQSVILENPILLICYGIALLLCIYDSVRHTTGYVFAVLSGAVFAATTVYAVLAGASLTEIAAVAMILLIVNLLSYKSKGRGKE